MSLCHDRLVVGGQLADSAQGSVIYVSSSILTIYESEKEDEEDADEDVQGDEERCHGGDCLGTLAPDGKGAFGQPAISRGRARLRRF